MRRWDLEFFPGGASVSLRKTNAAEILIVMQVEMTVAGEGFHDTGALPIDTVVTAAI